jgi:hypothetical protein
LLFPAKAIKAIMVWSLAALPRAGIQALPCPKHVTGTPPRQQMRHAFSPADSRWQTKAAKAINEREAILARPAASGGRYAVYLLKNLCI